AAPSPRGCVPGIEPRLVRRTPEREAPGSAHRFTAGLTLLPPAALPAARGSTPISPRGTGLAGPPPRRALPRGWTRPPEGRTGATVHYRPTPEAAHSPHGWRGTKFRLPRGSRLKLRANSPMPNPTDTFLSGSNIDFIEGLYARWLEDPSSVDPSWRELFARTSADGRPILGPDGLPRPPNGQRTPTGAAPVTRPINGNGAAAAVAPAPAPSRPQVVTVGDVPAALAAMQLQARVDQTLYAFRLRGHLLAQLCPLGRPRPQMNHIADLAMASDTAFRPEELEQVVDSSDVFAERKRVKLKELLARLRRTYCGHIGVEYMTLLDSDRRRWLMPRMEHTENQLDPSPSEQRHILESLTYAETFEAFIHTKYQGAKRFSVDGGESLLPMLDTMLELGGNLGAHEAVVGM